MFKLFYSKKKQKNEHTKAVIWKCKKLDSKNPSHGIKMILLNINFSKLKLL